MNHPLLHPRYVCECASRCLGLMLKVRRGAIIAAVSDLLCPACGVLLKPAITPYARWNHHPRLITFCFPFPRSRSRSRAWVCVLPSSCMVREYNIMQYFFIAFSCLGSLDLIVCPAKGGEAGMEWKVAAAAAGRRRLDRRWMCVSWGASLVSPSSDEKKNFHSYSKKEAKKEREGRKEKRDGSTRSEAELDTRRFFSAKLCNYL